MIVSAAIRIKGLILSVPRPGRHHSVMNALEDATDFEQAKNMLKDADQGFLTEEGEFLTRAEALTYAIKFNQVKLQNGRPVLRGGGILTSEDLW